MTTLILQMREALVELERAIDTDNSTEAYKQVDRANDLLKQLEQQSNQQ